MKNCLDNRGAVHYSFSIKLSVRRKLLCFLKIVGIFSKPKETFVSIDEKPNWFFPFIILIIISIISLIITYHNIILPEQISRITEMRDLTEEQLAKVKETIGGISGLIISLVSVIFALPIFLFAKSGVLFVCSNIFGGETTFKKVLSVSSWALLVEALATVIKTPIMLLKHSSEVVTSLALFFPYLSHESICFKFLNKFDFFTVWELALIGIGLGIVSKFSTKKGVIIVFSLWILWIIISVLGSKFLPRLG